MYIIKTYVDKSRIDGLGVFTSENITKGETVWRFEPKLDRVISIDDFNKMPQIFKDHILKCGFLSEILGLYILGVDNDIFANNSNENNLCEDTSKPYDMIPDLIAVRDIKVGEELTQQYFEYDEKNDAEYKLTHYNS